MESRQREHIAAVMEVAAADDPGAQVGRRHDAIIRESWRRCVHQHRLDPARLQEPLILPSTRLREHQDQMEDFLHIARHGLEALYQQVAGLGYVVLLTDPRGVTVDFLGDLQLEQGLRKAGLYLGADWSEHHAGTCGIGTCITTGEALTVHLADHFDATHLPLTCTAAPVFDASGELGAVLDISALRAPEPKSSQHLALQLAKVYAHHIENASFLHRFRSEWVLRLSSAPQFLDVNPEYLLAVDAAGRVLGHNRRAQLLLQQVSQRPALIGAPLDGLLEMSCSELGRFVRTQPSDQRAVRLAGGRQLLFMSATPPPARPLACRPARERAVPAPLAALSGGDPVLDRQIERAARLASSPISLLVTGETGSGKEYFAKAVHASSERRHRPFIAVNCAAIPETLIESELFGHLPGSFTGAGARSKRGLIQAADSGTLFLDEIGDMPLALQARLLRVLAEREVLPIGASRPLAVDIRVIAATHCDLLTLVRQGRFREDLYYRLKGAHLMLPPLRERRDLGWMIDRLLQQGGAGSGKVELTPAARELLLAHRWPGNLRELRNALDYACSVCNDGRIGPEDLPDELGAPPSACAAAAAAGESHEAAALLQQLQACAWNVSTAARRLGLSRMTLYRRMKRWGIVPPNRLGAAPAP